ncbi:MAG: hypothetical protein KDC48_03365 [Planctomycetes bacterium]|nr:hypothetical protein [Planctomycetota bacterium]
MRRLPLLVCLAAVASTASAQGFHLRRPNRYKQTAADNAITALDRRVAAGEVQLPVDGRSGRLRALLHELGVPESSQTLVFSKTSLQRHRVSPRSPRALYFGPDVYVGWVPGAAALEVAASDPRLGVVFYTVSQDPEVVPRLVRDDSCLSCHATSRTDDEPGLLLRSVFPDENGDPIASAGEAEMGLGTPLSERWGGWLVTGTFAGAHRGNGVAVRDERDRWSVPPRPAADLGAFAERFDAADYLAPTSDVAALLVLEQQVVVHNRLIRAALQMRCLLEADRVVNGMLGETGMREQTAEICDDLARAIAADLLCGGEVSLRDAGAAPDAAFARDFAALWPRDTAGRQLGELDLRERVFALPLSPMVHSAAFAALPDELRQRVLHRLHRALADGSAPRGVRLDAAQRDALHGLLLETLPGYRE